MQHNESSNNLNNFEDEISLNELFKILIDGKWFIIPITFFFSILGVVYSLMLPNLYESRALLAPSTAAVSVIAL